MANDGGVRVLFERERAELAKLLPIEFMGYLGGEMVIMKPKIGGPSPEILDKIDAFIRGVVANRTQHLREERDSAGIANNNLRAQIELYEKQLKKAKDDLAVSLMSEWRTVAQQAGFKPNESESFAEFMNRCIKEAMNVEVVGEYAAGVIKNLREKIEEYKKELARVDGAYNDARAQIDVFKDRIGRYKAEVSRLDRELEAARDKDWRTVAKDDNFTVKDGQSFIDFMAAYVEEKTESLKREKASAELLAFLRKQTIEKLERQLSETHEKLAEQAPPPAPYTEAIRETLQKPAAFFDEVVKVTGINSGDVSAMRVLINKCRLMIAHAGIAVKPEYGLDDVVRKLIDRCGLLQTGNANMDKIIETARGKIGTTVPCDGIDLLTAVDRLLMARHSAVDALQHHKKRVEDLGNLIGEARKVIESSGVELRPQDSIIVAATKLRDRCANSAFFDVVKERDRMYYMAAPIAAALNRVPMGDGHEQRTITLTVSQWLAFLSARHNVAVSRHEGPGIENDPQKIVEGVMRSQGWTHGYAGKSASQTKLVESAAWTEIRRLIKANAMHRDGFYLQDVDEGKILDQSMREFIGLMKAPDDAGELADLFGTLIHYAIFKKWTANQLEELLLSKLKLRFFVL